MVATAHRDGVKAICKMRNFGLPIAVVQKRSMHKYQRRTDARFDICEFVPVCCACSDHNRCRGPQ